MPERIIVAKVPVSYTYEQKKQLGKSIQFAVDQTKVLVVPEEVEVYSLPYRD